jgi:hypothetical protein
MSAPEPERLFLPGEPESAREASPRSYVEIELDGMTLRDSQGGEIATFTAGGWLNPGGIRTDRLQIPLGSPTAMLKPADVAEHQRKADAAWLDDALGVLRDVAGTRQSFTVDDVWQTLQMPPRDARNQMSRLMRAGEREGLMRLTDQTRPCARNNGGRRVRVWRSLIHPRETSVRRPEADDAR